MTNKFFPIENNLLTNKIIKDTFRAFWYEISNKFKDDNYMRVMLKIQFENDNIRSLTNLVKVDKKSKEGLLEYLLERFNIADESYKVIPITGMIFSYSFKKGVIKGTFSGTTTSGQVTSHILDTKHRTRLPISTKIEDYGKILLELNLADNKKFYIIRLSKERYLHITQDSSAAKHINKISYFKK